MRRILLALILTAAIPSVSTAQSRGERIAYDYCQRFYWFDENGWTSFYRCDVYVFDVGGSGWSGEGFGPALSPDGTRVAFVVGTVSEGFFEPSDIIVVDLRDKTYTNVTANDPAPASSPAWSWDGRLAFESTRSGSLELYAMNADGTGLAQLTNGIGFRGHPTWSRDGRIAFECTGEAGGQNLCSINADGTGFLRLTGPGGDDSEPAFSPDGTRIAFNTTRFGGLAVLSPDGTITPLANESGIAPTWSPDGRQLAFFRPDPPWEGACNADGSPCGPNVYAAVYMMDLATTNVSRLSAGANPGWAQAPPGGFPPTASFTIACTLLTCTFDASRSRGGTIASYSWRFDDGTVQAGIRTPHTYARSGRYSVELLVVDDYGLRGTSTRTFDVTDSPPTASFTAECSGLTCRFDGSGSSDRDGTVLLYAWSFGDGRTATTSDAVVNHSYAPGTYTVSLTVSDNAGATSGAASRAIVVVNSPPVASFGFSCDSLGPVCTFSGSGIDSDGVIVGYAWDFGDGTSGAGSHVTHTYAAAGTYNVRLTVTDNHGATNSRTASVTVASVVLHVGDLDGATDIQKRSWTAFVTIRVHDAEHRPVSARVDGMWSTGQSDYCSGDSSGACTLARSFPTPGSVTFTVQRLSLGLAAYDAARNHDVDGGTNGTSITLMRK